MGRCDSQSLSVYQKHFRDTACVDPGSNPPRESGLQNLAAALLARFCIPVSRASFLRDKKEPRLQLGAQDVGLRTDSLLYNEVVLSEQLKSLLGQARTSQVETKLLQMA